MDRVLLTALLILPMAFALKYYTLPGFGWSVLPTSNSIYTVGVIHVVKGEGFPINLGPYFAVSSSSGSCTPFWWKDVVGASTANNLGYTGKGIKVLIIDSGVDDRVLYQVFGKNVTYHVNAALQVYKDACIGNRTIDNVEYCILSVQDSGWQKIVYAIPLNASLDEMGHGTAVAATILSVAPDVTIYSARVTVDMLIVDDQWRLYQKIPLVDPFAVNWALTHAVYGPDGKPDTSDDADIVNMSLGGMYYPLPGPLGALDIPDQLLIWYLYREPIQKLSDKVLFVAAEGNDAENIPAVPAGIDEVTAVAALEYLNGQWEVAPFSQTGYGTDFAELGAGMYLPVPSYSVIAQMINDECSNVSGVVKWVRLDGTSFAAPMLSGIAALWAQYTGDRGTKLYDDLKNHALDLGSPGYDESTGWGMPVAPPANATLTSSSSGVPALSLLALLIRRRKKALAAVLLLSVVAFAASNVTSTEFSIAMGLASAMTMYILNQSVEAALISGILSMALMMASLFIAMIILKLVTRRG